MGKFFGTSSTSAWVSKLPPVGHFALEPLTVTVHIDSAETFTTVFLVGEHHAGIGTAKRNPRDRHNPKIGIDVAFARALREMADRVEAGKGL